MRRARLLRRAAVVPGRGAPRQAPRGGPHVLRHTYISTRIQTLDKGEPIAAFTVAREVGHRSTEMIEKVYGQLGEARHRASVVEYRVRHGRGTGKQVAKP